MTFEEARKVGPVYVVGCDPGPVCSAVVAVDLRSGEAKLAAAVYADNKDIAEGCLEDDFLPALVRDQRIFLAYESCGAQGKFVGESTFETAAMGGEIRRAFRPYVAGAYVFRPSDWRYMLCGKGNARTPEIYAEFARWFAPYGGGSDKLRGNKTNPGPLALLHQAGAGGNMEHMKDALGVALALDRVRYRSGRDPEEFRRPW